jgi:hypothetical protein
MTEYQNDHQARNFGEQLFLLFHVRATILHVVVVHSKYPDPFHVCGVQRASLAVTVSATLSLWFIK